MQSKDYWDDKEYLHGKVLRRRGFHKLHQY